MPQSSLPLLIGSGSSPANSWVLVLEQETRADIWLISRATREMLAGQRNISAAQINGANALAAAVYLRLFEDGPVQTSRNRGATGHGVPRRDVGFVTVVSEV